MSNGNINGLFVYVVCSIISTVADLRVIPKRNESSIPGTGERFSSASKGPDSRGISHGFVFSG
jgi:hypothetical protein